MRRLCACCPGTAAAAEPHAELRSYFSSGDLDLLEPAERAEALEREAAFFDAAAWHEAGHAIACLAFGRPVLHATIGGAAPHVAHVTGLPWYGGATALLIRSIAGSVAEGIHYRRLASPDRETLRSFLAEIRAGGGGTCDRCQEAAFVGLLPGDDDALADEWHAHWTLTLRLFDEPEMRGALRRVAAELRRRVLLTGADIAILVDPEALAAARRRVLEA